MVVTGSLYDQVFSEPSSGPHVGTSRFELLTSPHEQSALPLSYVPIPPTPTDNALPERIVICGVDLHASEGEQVWSESNARMGVLEAPALATWRQTCIGG